MSYLKPKWQIIEVLYFIYIYLHVGGEDAVDEILLRQVEGALQLIVVEGNLSRARAVESGLHECGPGVLQEKPPTNVVFTDARYAGIDRLPTVVLHGVLSQEEEGEEADVVGRDEVRLWAKKNKTAIIMWGLWGNYK